MSISTVNQEPQKWIIGLVSLLLTYGLIIIACVVLISWFWNIPIVYRVLQNWPAMVPNTAVGFVLSGVSLLLLRPQQTSIKRRRISQVFSFTCMMLGLVTLLEYLDLWPRSLVIDELLAGLFPLKPFVLRPSPQTSFAFLIAGLSLFLLAIQKPVLLRISLGLAFAILIVPIIVLFGYLYGQAALYSYTDVIGMAVHTAVGFIILSFAILLARPNDGLIKAVLDKSIGGRVVRRLLPAVILVPFLLGWLILYGQRSHLYSSGFGVALLEVLGMLVLVAVILHTSRIINREEVMRLSAEAELRKSEENLREFALHLEKIREEERVSVARDIHDEIGGMLAALKMDMGLLSNRLKQENVNDLVYQRLSKISEHIDQLMQTVRRIISNLRPSILDNLGLLDAIEWQLSELQSLSGIRYNYDRYIEDAQLECVNDQYFSHIFRIFQEITTNIVKHAQASMITVLVTVIDDLFVLSVSDNGLGISDEKTTRVDAFGLTSIRERAHSMRGECSIVSRENFGTNITITIPLMSQDV